MIRRILALLVVGLLVWLVKYLDLLFQSMNGARMALTLGFLLLASYLVGVIGERFKLPRITGYIVAGVVCGPCVAGLLSEDVLGQLVVFRDMAYGFIGLAAGSELRLSVLRARARSVLLLITFTTLIVIVGMTGVALAFHSMMPFMVGRPLLQVLAMCSLVGVVSAARSPSSAIAIISETRAEGPFSETILGVAMSMDLLILPLFSFIVAVAGLVFSSGQALDLMFLLAICGEIAASIALGVGLGYGVSVYIKKSGPQLALVLVGLCFLAYRCSQAAEDYLLSSHDMAVHFEPLLICAAAGFTIENVSAQGNRLRAAMESVALPVFVIFFTMAGANLRLGAVIDGWAVALVFVVGRLIMISLGCGIATRLAGDPPEYRRYAWLGFVTQAGVSIALASQLATAFGDWGRQLGTLLVAAIAINQIVGPVAFKYSLEKVGETRRARRKAQRALQARESTP